MSILIQKDLIEKDDWDVIIILDACRYDYFLTEYPKYLPLGYVEKVLANPYGGWAYSTFTRKYDAVYFTANPNARPVHSFKRVVDIWREGWDEKLGTVPPWEVNRAVLREDWDRAVIHYLQPHGPWIGKHSLYESSELRPRLGGDVELIPKLRKLGKWHVKELYIDNLHLVLAYASALLESIKGKVVITSDHGECLGEHNKYLHTPMYEVPEIKLVPWWMANV